MNKFKMEPVTRCRFMRRELAKLDYNLRIGWTNSTFFGGLVHLIVFILLCLCMLLGIACSIGWSQVAAGVPTDIDSRLLLQMLPFILTACIPFYLLGVKGFFTAAAQCLLIAAEGNLNPHYLEALKEASSLASSRLNGIEKSYQGLIEALVHVVDKSDMSAEERAGETRQVLGCYGTAVECMLPLRDSLQGIAVLSEQIDVDLLTEEQCIDLFAVAEKIATIRSRAEEIEEKLLSVSTAESIAIIGTTIRVSAEKAKMQLTQTDSLKHLDVLEEKFMLLERQQQGMDPGLDLDFDSDSVQDQHQDPDTGFTLKIPVLMEKACSA